MIQFTIITAAILIITLYFLLLPILRNRNTNAYARSEQNIHFAQQRLQELETQLTNGSISTTDYETLKHEIEQTLIDDLEQPPEQVINKQVINNAGKGAWVFIISFIPIATLCIYLLIGKPEAISYQQQVDMLRDPQNIAAILETIETRLQQQPNDEKGWSVLGNTYMAMGKFDEAQRAYRKLLQLTGNNPHVLTQLADALTMKNNGNMQGEPEQLIRKALSLDPNHAETLWLAGMAALQNKQAAKAKTHWQKLLPMLANMPEQQQELRTLIKQANNAISTAGVTNKKLVAGKKITVQVSIDDTLLQQVQPDNSVFIFAKAQQGTTAVPRAPLAVKRLTVADLPIEISLSDADAMMPQLTISKFDNIVVSARISKSGDPIAKAGDLQSEILAVNDTSTVKLIINQKIK